MTEKASILRRHRLPEHNDAEERPSPRTPRSKAKKTTKEEKPRRAGRRVASWPTPPIIRTIGHSTRQLEAFIAALRAHDIQCVADIRTIPRSQRNPQFNQDSLPDALQVAGIGYVHLPELGGLRHARRDSPNTAWRNASFRGFADYMQTPEFDRGIERLLRLARRKRVALMCAEAVPWRCHRSLVADALLARGLRVEHILNARQARPHEITPWAKVRNHRVTYPAK